MYLQSMHRFKGFRMNVVRPSNCYCPGQLLHRIIPKTIWCALTGNKLPLHGGGRAEKSYLHARDLADALLKLVESGDATMGKIYNVGPDKPTSIREVVERTAKAVGVDFGSLCEMTDDRLGQDSRYWLDSTRAKNELDWKQTVGWDEGLAEMVAWGQKYRDEITSTSTDYVLRA
jgi:dTDP-glucose 4,6-dehydratase